jgi:poly(3-hydroxybutyrate) depolymerase
MSNLARPPRHCPVRPLLALVLLATLAAPALAQTSPGSTIDYAAAPGANFDKAELRLWLPAGDATLRAIVLLVPGSNADGRGEVADAAWQAFATRHRLALVGCRLTDRPHDQSLFGAPSKARRHLI